MHKRIPSLEEFINESRINESYSVDVDLHKLAKKLNIPMANYKIGEPRNLKKDDHVIILAEVNGDPVTLESDLRSANNIFVKVWWAGGEYTINTDNIKGVLILDKNFHLTADDLVPAIKSLN